ncbi:MAG: putative sugar nucleotidyl transferase, partial [Planctomycetota bacterium]
RGSRYAVCMDEPRRAIFWDDGTGLLAPMRDLRPIFAVRTGALTTRERLTRALGVETAAVFVPEELVGVTRESHAEPVNELAKDAGPVLVLNGRCPLPLDEIDQLGEGSALVEPSGDVVAAYLDAAEALELLHSGRPDMEEVGLGHDVLITRPWHIRSGRDLCLSVDLQLLAGEVQHLIDPPENVTLIGSEPPRVAETATLFPNCVFDTTGGPIVIDGHATIRPRAIICGPTYIGPNSTVLDAAIIKPNTALGPWCKVAGEVGGTIMQGYSNKAHDGHLGDSWLGEWVNLGAGTVNSNLLNTYGEVAAIAEPGGDRELTGETFFGCVLGDHVKAAIGTRIFTGAIAHTGAMWAATEPMGGCVPRLCWKTDAGESVYRHEKFVEVARAAMGRRNVEPGEAYLERLASLAEPTK